MDVAVKTMLLLIACLIVMAFRGTKVRQEILTGSAKVPDHPSRATIV